MRELLVRRKAPGLVLPMIAAALVGCADDPAKPDGATVIGEVQLQANLTDETGVTQGTQVIEGASGLVVYLAQANALIDSVATEFGAYMFESVAPGAYEIVTWIVPADVVSSGTFDVGDDPIYTVVPLPIADPLALVPAVFENGAPVDSLALAVFPNPSFSPWQIEYALASQSMTNLVVEDAGGSLIRELVSGVQPAGRHRVIWDGKDSEGQDVLPGLYIVTSFTDTTEGWELIFREAVPDR